MNMRNIKRALISSALALLICVTTLIGSTFAWFTDGVTSGNNKIIAGNLDIALYKTEVNMDGIVTGNPVKETEITDSSAPLFDQSIVWEPGYEAVANLKLENKGNLAIEWNAVIRPIGEIGELAEVINVYVIKGEMINEANGRDYYADKLTFVGTLEDVLAGSAILNGVMKNSGDVEFFSILLKMQEEAGNAYQLKEAGEFDITILATQYTYESDSFDDQYDKNASIDDAVLIHGGTINVEEDIEEEVVVGKDAQVTLNLNNKVLKNTLTNNGDVNVNGGEINVNGSNALYNEGSAQLKDVTLKMAGSTGYIANSRTNGSITIYENVTATSSGGGLNLWQGEAVFKSGTITTNSTSTSARHIFYVAEGAKLTIEDGEFFFNPTNLTRKGSYICAQVNATVIVNGGIFHKPSTRTAPIQAIDGSSVVIYGGTFQFDPSAFVADGHVAVESNGWWTVSAQ